ncbi:MAG: quinone-dependent dihydroorotate dehydrogenase, partial [Deinococcota bacterium]
MYEALKPWLFRSDPETAHDVTMRLLERSSNHPGALRLISWLFEKRDPRLEVHRFGLSCHNPVGLAAGFDKDARATATWPMMGFGFVEVGSVTALAQPGNPKPRLFRLPDDDALINRFGFNNHGAQEVATRLAHQRKHVNVPIGVNIGKSKVVPLEDAASDYLASLKLLWKVADYITINVSSPNTVGLRELQRREYVDGLLTPIAEFVSQQPESKPWFVKVTVDAPDDQLDAVLASCETHAVTGVIMSNTTVNRDDLRNPHHLTKEAGWLSGKPLAERGLEGIKNIKQRAPELGSIAVGGISS